MICGVNSHEVLMVNWWVGLAMYLLFFRRISWCFKKSMMICFGIERFQEKKLKIVNTSCSDIKPFYLYFLVMG